MSVPTLLPYPTFSPVIVPELPSLNLSEDERNMIARLQSRFLRIKPLMELTDAYYRGEQVMTNLGIAIPPELQGLRTVIGWPAVAVDPIDERCTIQGFRLRGATDVDQDLQDLWDANNLDAEQSPVHIDALSMGSGWLTVGSGDSPGDPAVICAESPLNMVGDWDARLKRLRGALQTYWFNGKRQAALYLPDQTIYLGDNDQNEWVVENRDVHKLGRPTATRIVNKPRTNARDGGSEITRAIMSITDSACRALLNLQVAGEIYSVPMRYMLGATEADFQDAEGNPKTAFQTYMTRILALERDENGDLPTVGSFPAYDPTAITNVLDFYASKMAGMIGATPQDLGLYSDGNPPSADAISFTESRRTRKALRKHALFSPGWIEAMQLGVMIQNGGTLPADMQRMAVDWEDPNLISLSATGDFLQKLVSVGSLPAASDVTLKRAGFSAIERAQLEQDRKTDIAAQQLAELASSLQVKDARAATTVAHDLGPQNPPQQQPTVNGPAKP